MAPWSAIWRIAHDSSVYGCMFSVPADPTFLATARIARVPPWTFGHIYRAAGCGWIMMPIGMLLSAHAAFLPHPHGVDPTLSSDIFPGQSNTHSAAISKWSVTTQSIFKSPPSSINNPYCGWLPVSWQVGQVKAASSALPIEGTASPIPIARAALSLHAARDTSLRFPRP